MCSLRKFYMMPMYRILCFWYAMEYYVQSAEVGVELNAGRTNTVPLVRERTIPAERPPLVGEISANFCGLRVSRGQRDGSVGHILGYLDRASMAETCKKM
jgi:hypothetical protein